MRLCDKYCVYHTRVTVNMSQKIRNNRRIVVAVGSHFRGDDLLGFNVCRDVEFTPSVFVNLPFTLAVNLQTGTVYHNVKRPALTVYFERNVQRFRTFTRGRIIGTARLLNFEDGKHVPPKPFGASIGKEEDFENA